MKDIEERLHVLSGWGADPNSAIKRMMGDEDLFLKLLSDFLSSRDWDKLIELINQGSFEEAFIISHRMKGSSADLSLGPIFKSLCNVTDDLRGEVRESLGADLRVLYLQRDSLTNILHGDLLKTDN